jgi:type I restriction enzyme M protein
MENNRKEQERAELHRTIWNMANDLRGSVDGWDFKQYVLGMLFYRYISENITAYINAGEWEAGNTEFDYAKLSDEEAEQAREDLVKTKGFFILPSELFENVRARAKDDENLNETLEQVFSNIEASAQGTESEDNFKGLFDDIDVNSNKLGNTVVKRNEKLVKLMNSVGEMKLGDYKDNTIDAFGDAYEFLMGMYASNAGKSGGEYYTPQEVSELLTHLTLVGKTEVNKVYDPACGSGSLLLKFAKILGKENVRQGFFGQEINITTYNLCRINMFLHDIDYDKFDIALGDTLTDPQHWDDEPFEAIVSNPPYSIKWKGDNDPILINDPRFSPAGVLAPKSKADLAFIMHSLSWLATNGTAAKIEYPGIQPFSHSSDCWVISIKYSRIIRSLPLENTPFDLPILRHGSMTVQMIRRQIEQQSHPGLKPVDPFQLKAAYFRYHPGIFRATPYSKGQRQAYIACHSGFTAGMV